MLSSDLREVFRPDWSGFHPQVALRTLPAVAAAIGLGRLAGIPEWGITAAAGAVSVGFGAFQQAGGSRVSPMLFATGGMCVASYIGTMAGLNDVVTIAAIALAGFFYIAISSLQSGYSWAALQSLVWLIISTAFPARGLHACERAGCMLAGGAMQILFTEAFWLVEGLRAPAMKGISIAGSCTTRGIREVFNWRSCLFPFGIRALVTLGSAAAIYRIFHIRNGYWIPMTCALVLRGEIRQSVIRGAARLSGTMIGAGVATLIASLLRPSSSLLTSLVLMFAALSSALLWVNYAFFVTVLTAYVVFLLALAGLPESIAIQHRLINTLLAGALTIGWHGVFFLFMPERSTLPPQETNPQDAGFRVSKSA